MSLTYGFFDARQSTGGVYDRVYSAEQMSKYFKGIITDGVLMNVDGMFAVTASSGMVVHVATGRAFLDSRWVENDTIIDLTIPAAHAILNRYDLVVARLDYENRLITIAVKSGTAATTPTAPSVTRNTTYYELSLAKIYVAAGATSIVQSNITDTRADQTVCGYVTGLITQIDTATFWTQLQAAFLTWFDEMKDQLDEDAAGHIELQIQNILGDFATVELTSTASQAYKAGDFLVYEELLYKVTTDIASGGTITPGTNVTQTTVSAENKNRTLWWSSKSIASTSGSSGTLLTITDARITADHVLDKFVPANGNVITSGISCTTSAGKAVITGTSTATTTAEIKLVKKDN